MWIVIKGIRYNFDTIESYNVLGTKVLLTVPSDRPETKDGRSYVIECKTILDANELVDKIDTLLGTQTL